MSENYTKILNSLFLDPIILDGNFSCILRKSNINNQQQQTNNIFSEKWTTFSEYDVKKNEIYHSFQRKWYLKLYGFDSEDELRNYLSNKQIIFDAGCGLGNKAAWFAKLAPHALVIAMDISEAALVASRKYKDVPNLFFVQRDISANNFEAAKVDFVSCDQVIMHTTNPELTFSELCKVLSPNNGEIACYFYKKKALPRELLDDYFRLPSQEHSVEDLWKLSEQLTELGRRLSDLNVLIDVPDIPILGIKGGSMDIQRFIYWNFIKYFFNQDFGHQISASVNFDWYGPSNARRFSKDQVMQIIKNNNMNIIYFHESEPCYAGRFTALSVI
jgi:ubiquinone/menaquinone biosynthesis C-methylase UbiE